MNNSKYDFKGSKTIRKREVQASIQGINCGRVSGKRRDKLQTIIAACAGRVFGPAPTVQ
jgi:uncharacterized protein YajQ (UPF0234 family)